jgi:hypothetical protein
MVSDCVRYFYFFGMRATSNVDSIWRGGVWGMKIKTYTKLLGYGSTYEPKLLTKGFLVIKDRLPRTCNLGCRSPKVNKFVRCLDLCVTIRG